MKELHSFGWYASRVAKKLPKHVLKPVPSRLWGGLVYLLISLAGLTSIIMFDMSPWFYLLIAFVLGNSFASMGFLGHEILHGTVVKKPWVRNFLGAVAFWPLSTGPRLWRKWHNMDHHVHTQHEELDPDSWPSLRQLSKIKILRWIYKLPLPVRAFFSFLSLTITFTMHSLRMFVVYLKEFKSTNRPMVVVQLILPWVTWIGLLVWIGPLKWLFAFVIPLLIANFIVMAYISTNHRLNPLVPVNDPLANSLTVTVPKWVDALHFNFSYHTEHHLFPAMSSKYYPMVKEHIKSMWPERYHEMPMTKALVTLWRTPRVYHDDGTALIDPYPGNVYGSLGHGLDPAKIKFQKLNLKGTAFFLKKGKTEKA
ncbi:fatty acid desaturase family protein [Bacillus fonticola]|uniref:fatty acid desaturase family protein n=1 Tax=Bacillus fonticola TaxID=2728853 RepID=UPI001475FD6A|nr:acyl-CoA desaturase [Bacillus fonticola]